MSKWYYIFTNIWYCLKQTEINEERKKNITINFQTPSSDQNVESPGQTEERNESKIKRFFKKYFFQGIIFFRMKSKYNFNLCTFINL